MKKNKQSENTFYYTPKVDLLFKLINYEDKNFGYNRILSTNLLV